jgi:hypothetical protein
MLSAAIFSPEGKQLEGPRPLAVLVEGQFPDAYVDREIPQWPQPSVTNPEEQVTPLDLGPDIPGPVTPAPGKLLVIGSAKMFDDNIVGAMQNPLLLLNAADYLAGSQELLSIRSKTLTQRIIRPVDQGGKVFWRVVTIFLVPVLLAGYGFTRSAMRRKEAHRYRQELKRLQGAQRQT